MLGLGLDGFAIVATIMTLPKPKMMMRLRKERKLSYIRVNTASEFLAGNDDFVSQEQYRDSLIYAVNVGTHKKIAERENRVNRGLLVELKGRKIG